MPIQRLALISVHASPLAPMGGSKTGGLNVYIKKLAQELASRDIQVDIFTRRTSGDLPQVDYSLGKHVRVIHISAGMNCEMAPDEIFSHLPAFVAGMIAFSTRHNTSYDLIYSHYWLSGWVAIKLREIWGTPFVHMFHTLGHMKNRILPTATASLPNQRIRVETEITAAADRIIAATPAEHTQLRWLYRASRHKITIISPGVDLKQFHPMPVNTARAQIGISEARHVLLFVGRIEPLKAIDTVIRSMANIRADNPALFQSLCFIVVGGNPADPVDAEMARLKTLVKELNLDEQVQFAGAKDRSTLAVYYAAASILVMPSDYESFGMAALESMASATPVIASAVGGLAYLVRDGETGYLVPSREPEALTAKIVQFLELDSEQRTAMRAAALSVASQYDWSTIADTLLASFESLLTSDYTSHHKN